MKKIFSLLTALILVCGLATVAFAHEVPDLEKNGTITLALNWGGEPLNGGKLTLYRVGDIVENNGDYSFAPVKELRSNNLSLTDVNELRLAKELADLAQQTSLPGVEASITNGEAVFSDVVPGLYVVTQKESDATEGFAAINPFLISMPRMEDGHYETDVEAAPKVPLETAPPEPTKPADENLPQTGQLNWPVPLLAVSGLAMFTLGWLLCFRKKKETNEK